MRIGRASGTIIADPAAFSVVGGKLYLNLDPGVQARWVKDIPGFVKAADANWKTLAPE